MNRKILNQRWLYLAAAAVLLPVVALGCSSGGLTATEVYKRVSPAVAFIDVGDYGSGSGLLIEDNYILTAWHVITPLTAVRVTFNNGEEYEDVPVVASDAYRDLAILGPIETDIQPFTDIVESDAGIEHGDTVFLLGYPGETELLPQVSITQGIVSRFREWHEAELTTLQVDATIIGGQSGGVLISDEGRMLGISNYGAGDTVAYVNEISDLRPTIDSLLAGEDVNLLGDRDLPSRTAAGRQMFTGQLGGYRDRAAFVVSGDVGDSVNIQVSPDQDTILTVYNIFGDQYVTTEPARSFDEWFDIDYEGLYIIVVESAWLDGSGYEFRLETSHRATRISTDTDDGRQLAAGESLLGNIDYPGDADFYEITLQRGEMAEICVDSFVLDVMLSVEGLNDDFGESFQIDDDSFGYFGTSSHLSYTAPETDVYQIVVESVFTESGGGYEVFVGERCEAAANR